MAGGSCTKPKRRSFATFWVREVAEAFAMEKLDVDALLRQAGIARSVLADSDARIPADNVTRLWKLAIADSGNPVVGLTHWRQAKPAAFGVIAYAMMSAPDLHGLLRRLERYSRIVSDAGTIVLHRSPRGDRIALSLLDGESPPPWQEACFASLMLLGFCRWITHRDLRPLEMELAFPEPSDIARCRAALGFPVRFGADANALVFARAEVNRPLSTAEAELAPILDQVAEEHLSRLGYSGLRLRVQELIRKRLADGTPPRAEIAAALGMSERTLHRRLTEEETSFRDVVDVTRRELAQLHLANRKTSLADAAYLLGFADQSSFHRAYRRWFGMPPRAHRPRSSVTDASQ